MPAGANGITNVRTVMRECASAPVHAGERSVVSAGVAMMLSAEKMRNNNDNNNYYNYDDYILWLLIIIKYLRTQNSRSCSSRRCSSDAENVGYDCQARVLEGQMYGTYFSMTLPK